MTSGRSARVTVSPGDVLAWLCLPAVALWCVAVAVDRVGPGLGSVPHAHRVIAVSLFAVPAALVLAGVGYRAPSSALVRRCAWLAIGVAGAFLLAPEVAKHSTIAWAVPGAIVTAWVMMRRPAAGVALIIAATAAFGSLSAYTNIPYTRGIDLLLVGLWLAALARLALSTRARRFALWPGIALAILFLAVTVGQMLLAPSVHQAFGFFRVTDWYMLSLLLVAYSQWSSATHLRIVRFALVTALLVGIYAVVQLVRGPTAAEFAQVAKSGFNFVNGKPKLTGSFPNGADLGSWTTLMLPFCLSCALTFPGRVRIVSIAAMPLLAIGLVGSGVRAGGVSVLIAVLVVLTLHQMTRASPGPRLGRAFGAMLVVLAVGFGAYSLASSHVNKVGHNFAGLLGIGGSHDLSLSQHEYKWSAVFRDLPGHPFGFGLGAVPPGSPTDPGPQGAHLPANTLGVDNGYLEIAIQQGLAIMVLFALALLLVLGGLVHRATGCRDPVRAGIAIGAAGTLVALMVLEGAGAFIDSLPALSAWIVIGLGVAQFMPRRDSPDRRGAAAARSAAGAVSV